MSERYDAGLLSGYGGGNVEWWQDYIRCELDRAHEFYESASNSLIGEQAARIAEAQKDYHEERKARYAAQSQVEYLSNALAGMLDVWSGYPVPECDAAIAAMQLVGIDRWSAQAALGPDITSDDLIEAAGLTK